MVKSYLNCKSQNFGTKNVFCLNKTWNQEDFEKLNVTLGNIKSFSNHIDFISGYAYPNLDNLSMR